MDQESTPQEGINPETPVEVTETTESPEELKIKLAEALEAKRQLTARAKTAEEELKRLRPIKKEESKPYNILDDEVADLILDGYTKDDVRFIMSNGGRKTLEDKNSYVSIAIQTKREQRKAEEAAGKTTDSAGQSEIERKYTPEQLKGMSRAELEKILPRA